MQLSFEVFRECEAKLNSKYLQILVGFRFVIVKRFSRNPQTTNLLNDLVTVEFTTVLIARVLTKPRRVEVRNHQLNAMAKSIDFMSKPKRFGAN